MLSNVKKGDLIVTGNQESFIVIDTDYDRSKYPIKAVSINNTTLNAYFTRTGNNIGRRQLDIVAVYPMSTCLSTKHKELFIKESDFNQTYKQIDSNFQFISTGLFQNNLIVKASNKTYNLSSKKRRLMSTLEDYKQWAIDTQAKN